MSKAVNMRTYTIEKRPIIVSSRGGMLFDSDFDSNNEYQLPDINGTYDIASTDSYVLSREKTSLKKSDFDGKDKIDDSFTIIISHKADDDFDTEMDVTFCYDITYNYGSYSYKSDVEDNLMLPRDMGGIYEVR